MTRSRLLLPALLASALLAPGPATASPPAPGAATPAPTAAAPPAATASPAAAPAPDAPAHPPAKPAALVLRDLPKGSRVTLDGVPVGDPTRPVVVAPGTYVLDIYPPAAPTLERFVDLAPGARRVVTYRSGPPPDPPPRHPPVVGRALVGAGAVAALVSATWWLLADASAGAEARVQGQTGLDATTRAAMLQELEGRELLRRDVAVATGVTAGLLLVGGATLWRVVDAGGPVTPTVAPVPGGAVGGFTLRLP